MNPRDRQDARRGEGDREDSGPSWWRMGLGVAAGVATVAGAYNLFNLLGQNWEFKHNTEHGNENEDETDSYVNDITLEDALDAVPRSAILAPPSANNLNSLLNDIHIRYIAVKKEEFALRYKVLMKVFSMLHGSMKASDAYYNCYSSRLIFTSEESKMYIIIRLPVNIHEHHQDPERSDIIIEPKHASFVQLRCGVQYKNIIGATRKDSLINRTAYSWLDDSDYILNSRFISWFQSVVDRALNKLQGRVTFGGCEYKISTSFREGSFTLWITNASGFRCDVVLVPALRFPEDRWLGRGKVYRDIPLNCDVHYWMAIPKPNKFGANSFDEHRSWHIDMYEQEKKYIHNTFHLRQGMRLLKKLCDAQRMSHIEKYYIQTLFLWKCETFDKSFWQRDVATVFKTMLREFYVAVQEKKISFFWEMSHNLLENTPVEVLKEYAGKLGTLSKGLEDDNNYMMAAKYLLTDSEYAEYISLTKRYVLVSK